MGDRGSYGLSPRLDIQQLLFEAKHRWLRPAEICEILRNYQMSKIESEPPHKPQSGSIFIFDRKVLRYFRKDGHNWRKRKDGKTIKEAHEKLKVGSVDVLHCYYAHGEENENFQRRSYWMLEEELMHIVFVHYLEVKGTRTNNVGAPRETDVSSSRRNSPSSTSFSESHARLSSGYVDYPCTTSSMASLCEDGDSEDCYQATSNLYSFPELATAQTGGSPLLAQKNVGFPDFYYQRPFTEQTQPAQTDRLINYDDDSQVVDSQKALGTVSWEEILQQCTSGSHSGQSAVSTCTMKPITSRIVFGQENINSGINFLVDSTNQADHETSMAVSSNWQIPVVDNSLSYPKEHVDQLSELETVYDSEAGVSGNRNHDGAFEKSQKHNMSSNLQYQLANGESQRLMKFNSERDCILDGNVYNASTLRQSLLGGGEDLKKIDSFSSWICRELGDVDDLRMHPSPGISWSADECGNINDHSSLSPSLSQDQLFSITDYSPKWSFTDMETEVMIVGRFLTIHQDVAKCNWSCMFGEVEVPAMVLADGILCCRAPPHSTGQVPFYVTFSNRVACSEVREFQYLAGSVEDVDVTDIYDGGSNELLLYLQLDSLLSLDHVSPSNIFVDDLDKRNVISKLIALKEEKEYIVEPHSQEELIHQEKKKYFFTLMMKEMLYSWLLHKVVEDGKGPNVWDKNGQGVIHLAAALGYDWAMKPIVNAGVSINFRDVNGWTALHWAACCGREQTVAVLTALGSGTGLLTDPSPEYPLGRTPADLASANGCKGISGFLAESSLSSHLSTLTMNDTKQNSQQISSPKVVHGVSERIATPATVGYFPGDLSLKDSLTAVSHATQVADRIHMMFRMQSFQRKQFAKHDHDQFELLDDLTLSIVAARALKGGQGNGVAHSAAIHIQKKFRGWKKRKEFLSIRQRIVKIQAHVRGHQVRKKYPAMTWSIGIVDTLLRWRRKGSGQRPMVVPKGPTTECMTEEDDYDFLKKGRRQTEERLKKALTRVKSMAQDPQGRDQYRRLLTLVHEIRVNKASGMAVTGSENMVDEEPFDFDDILDDDTLMSMTFD